MPPVCHYGCNECDFELPSGWGGYVYAVDNLGARIVCGHPGEFEAVYRVTGMNYTEAIEAGRAGFAQHCVCLTCIKQFDLDLDRDAAVCPACTSPEVRSLRDLVGKKCPRCGVGVIEEGSIIRWKIDPDWEQLPVPQIVKDLTEFSEHRRIPESLKQAAEIANVFGEHNFFTVAIRLLGWWEGDYFAKNKEPKDSAEMRPQWTWCKALPAVLEATPALAELVVIRRGRCWFADGVSPETKRGIKNYLRKHRSHVVWS